MTAMDTGYYKLCDTQAGILQFKLKLEDQLNQNFKM